MNPATDLCFGKSPLTPSHGDSLEDHSFQSLKSKEVRDSQSPSREIKFRNSGGIAGGVLVPDTTGWNVQTSTEVSPDGRAFRSETLAKTDGVEQVAGGRAEFAGRNEQKSSASHQGDDQNYVKKAAESSKTHLQEKIVIGDENSGRTEMKSSSVTSSSSKVVSSSSTKVLSSGDPGFDLQPLGGLTPDQRYQQSIANTSALRSEQQKYQTSSNVRDTYEENKKYVDMDKASPEYQQHVQYLMAQPGTVVSNTVEYPKPGVKLITTVKQLPDGTTVKTKRYETEASADAGSISQTMKQQQRMTSSSTSSQKTSSEKRTQDTEDVFSRLTRPRDSGSRSVPETPSPEDIYSRLQKSRGSVNEKKFSETIDERSKQILRDTAQQPSSTVPRNAPTSRVPDLVDNVEVFSTKTVKKDLSQATRNEKITSADFIATERDRHVLDHESPIKRGPDGLPSALAPITPGGYGRPHPDEVVPTNGYTSTGVVQQTSKSSSKFSESRRFSTETVESYQHSESHNESQDFTTHGFPSVRRPIDEPKGRSPSAGRPSQGFSTHGFPSVRSDKPTQEYPSDRPRPQGEYTTPERQHPVKPVDENVSSTTRANYSTNETRRHVTSTTNDFSTHGFPSVRPDTPTRDSNKRPTGLEPAGASPRRPSGQDQPQSPGRKPSTDGYSSTHGFPSVKTPSPGDVDAPRRPSGVEPAGLSPRRPSAQDQPHSPGRKPSTDGYSSTHGFPSSKTPTPSDFDAPRRSSGTVPSSQGRRPAPDDFSTHGFPSVKPGRTTPTQSSPQYEDTNRTTPVRRLPSVDREDTVSVTSDRSNSITYEKRTDAAHQAFARSLRCSSPVDTIRRDSVSDRQTPRSSVTIVRHTYVPSKRDGRSPSHESITNSESSRISSGTVTKTYRSPAPDNRRPSGQKSPLNKAAPSHVSNETIDLTLTRKITARPADKPTPKQTPVKAHSQLAEPILRKEVFAATEGFLASEGVVEEPILRKDDYYQLGPSDATLPSSRQKRLNQLIGATPTTPRRPTTHTTEEEVNHLLDTATKHTTPKRTPTSPDTKPTKPDTLYSTKPKASSPEGYQSLTRATEITEKHNQTTNKPVSSPHFIPTAPKADRSPSDRPTKTLPSSAPTSITTTTTTTSTTIPHHSAPKSSVTDKPKPSSSPSKPETETETVTENSTTRLTKTTRDSTTTRREPEPERRPGPHAEPLSEPEDTDEGYVPDRKGRSKPRSQRPTSDDEGFEPDSPRAGSPTSDFEFHRSRPTEPVDEEDAIFRRTRKTDRKTVTNEFLDTERGVKQPRRPKDGDREPRYPGDDQPGAKQPRQPEDLTRQSPLVNESGKPSKPDEPKRPQFLPTDKNRRTGPLNGEPDEPRQGKPRRPDEEEGGPRSPSSKPRRPDEETVKPVTRRPSEQTQEPTDREPRSPDTKKPRDGKPPLDRSETFDERCRQILGMETETKTEKTKRLQEFIDTERDTVYVQQKPDDRVPTSQKKTPFDTVSIEDCDDDDTGAPKKRPTQSTTTVTRTTKTTNGEYPRDKSPTEKRPKGTPGSPIGTRPTKPTRGTGPTETVVTQTTTTRKTTGIAENVDDTRRPKGYPRSDISDEVFEPSRRRPESDKPRERGPTDDTTVRKTTTIITETDERSSLSSPKDYPRGRSPTEKDYPRGRSPTEKDYPRGKSPNDKPRGRSPTDDTTVKRTTKVTEDTTFTSEVDQRAPRTKDYPRGRSPTEKPRGRSPTDDTTVKRTTKVTEDTTFTSEVDQRSPLSRLKDYPRGRSPNQKEYPRGRSPTEKDYPRGKSPNEKPRGRSPTDDTTVKRTTKVTEDTTFTSEVDQRSPLSRPKDYPRGRSPTEKPRGRSPTDDTTVKRTTKVTEDSTFTSEVDQRSPLSRPKDYPRGRSPTEKDYPRGKSPNEKPRGRSPTDDTTVKRTTKVTEDTTFTSEVDQRSPDYPRGRSPTEKDYPRGKSPNEKPRGRSPTDDTTVKRTTKVTEDTTFTSEVDQRSPLSRPKDYPRGRSPTEKDYPRGKSPNEKPRGRSPTDDTTVKRTTKVTEDTTFTSEVDQRSPDYSRGRSPTEKDYPRGKSPNEKPRGRSPTDDTTVKRTTKVTEDTTFTSEVDQRSPLSRPKDYPRGRSPTEKDYPRGRSPNEKPRGRSPTDDTTVKRTTKVTEDTTFTSEVDQRSPDYPRGRSPTEKDYPRGKSPTEKPRGRSPTDDTTLKRTTKVTEDTTFTSEVDQRSPDYPRGRSPTEKDYPRGRSPTEKPRGRSPTDDTTVKRTTKVTEDTTFTSEVDQRSPRTKDYPRGRSPTEKPRGRSPTDDTTVKRTTTVTEDTTFISEVDQRSPRTKDYPRGRSPTEKDYPRGKSPTEKPRGRSPTDDTTLKRTTKVTEDTTFTSEVDQRSPDYPRGRSPTEKDYPRGRSPTEKPRGRSPTDDTTVKRTTKVTEDTTFTSEVDQRSPLSRPKDYPRGRSPTEKDYPRGRSPNEKPRGRSPTDDTTVKRTTKVTEDTTFTSEVDQRSPDYPRGRSPTEKDYPRGKSPTEKPRGRSPTDDTTLKRTTKVTEDTTFTSEVDQRSPDYPRGRSPTEKDYPRGRSPTEKPRGRSPTDDTTVKRTTKVTEDTTFTSEVDQRSPDYPRGRSPTEKDYPRGRSPTEKPRGRSPTDDTTVKRTTKVTEDTTFISEVDQRSPLSRPKDYPRGRSPTEKDYPRGKSPNEKPRGRSPTDDTTVKRTTKVTEDTTFTSEVDQRSPDYPRGRSPTEKDYPRGRSPTEKPRGRSPTDDTTVKRTTKVTEDTTFTSEVDQRSPDYPRGRSPTEKDYPRGRSPTEKPRGRSPTDDTTVKRTTKVTEDTTFISEVDQRSPLSRPKDYPRGRSPTEKDYPRGKSPNEKPRGRSPTDDTTVKRTTKVTEDTTFTSEVDQRSPDYPRGRSPTEKDYPRGRSPTEKPRGRSPTDDTTVKRTTKVTEDTTFTSEVDQRSPRTKDYPRGRSPTEKDYPRGKSPNEKPRGRSPTDDTTVKRTTKVTEDTTFTSEVDQRSPLSRPKDYPRGRSPTEKDYPRGRSPNEKPRGRSPTDDTTVKRTTKVTEDTTFISEVDQRSPRTKDYPRGRSPTEKDYPRGKSPNEKPHGRSPTDDTTVKRTTKVTEDTTFTSEVDQRSPTSRRKEPRQPQRLSDRSPSPLSKDKLPKEKPVRGAPSDDESPFEETVVQCTTTTSRERTISEEITDRTSKVRPREASPSDKPGPREKSPCGKPMGPMSTKDRPRGTSPTQKKPQLRDQSPTEKPKGSRPISDTNVQKMVKTITESTVVDERSPKERPRGLSPAEKPKRRQPIDGVEEVVTERTTQVVKDTRRVDADRPRSPLSDEVSPDEDGIEELPQAMKKSPSSPRDRSPSEKPKGAVPTADTTVKRVVKSTVIEERVAKGPRGPSPTGKPGPKTYPRDKSPKEKPTGPKPTSGTSVQRIIKTITERTALNERSPKGRPLETSPLDKPKRRPLTEEPTNVQRTSKTVKGTTVMRQTNVDTRSPKARPGQRAPTTKPKGAQPSDDESEEEITVIETWYSTDGITPQTAPSDVPTDEETLVQRTSRTTMGRTTVEQVDVHGRRPQGKSPTSPRDRSPLGKPKGTKPTDSRPRREPSTETTSVTVVQKTAKVTKVRPSDEEEYPSDEEIDEKYVRKTKTSRDTTTLEDVEDRPRFRSPISKQQPRDSSPSPVDETTVRSTMTKTIRQDTDFEKRYPNGRPREPSPTGKATPRRPSKPTTTSSTTTTTTTRNRSTLEEQDLSKSPRPKGQPSTRDKLPTKSTPSYVPHSREPTTEKRVPAELPSRKPKSTFGTTTRTTTQTTVTRLPATRPVPAKETPRKPSTGLRPTARQPERKQPESVSPDSSPSRPASEAAPESPNRSPNASPSRHSPSPTRSVKLEDITSSVVTTKKTTVVVDKTKPKVTHVTTAKFQVSPPTSPTKVMPAPEIKSSPARKPTPKPTVTKLTTNKTTTKVTTSRKDVVHPTDSERDSEVPTDAEDIDSPLTQKLPSKKMPVTLRKESAPVHRVTKVDKDVQKMSRSTSENLIKTTTAKRPSKQEPLEPIASGKTSPKTERRPNKHLSTKTINLTTFDKVINSQDMENVVIDIQQAKSSREPSPNKIVPTPVSVDLYTGKPRYPDVVQEPEDEPRKKPNVKNIPIFEEETNDFVGCQITEVHEDYLENTTKARTRKFIDGEARPQRPNPTIVTSDNVDNECLLSVHDKVSKFISTAEEVSKPKTSAPFRRDVPEEDAPEDDECLLSVDEKVSKFLKTAESVTKEVMTSTPKPIERPRIDDLDEDLRRDECVLSVSEKVNRFTTKAEKLAPSVPQRSPELVARIERQISKQSDVEPESPRGDMPHPDSPDDDDSPMLARKVKQTKSLFEREERKYTDRQIDILSRPSVWDKKPKSDVKLDDIIGEGPEDPEPRTDGYVPRKSAPGAEQPDAVLSKPVKPVKDTVSKKKEIFETKISTERTPATRPGTKSPEWTPRGPIDSPRARRPSDESDSWCPGPEPDNTTEETFNTSKARRIHETSSVHTTTVRESPERRSPTRKASQPEIRPSTQTPTRTSKRPGDHSPSRRYSDDPSPRPRSRDQPTADLYTETRQTSEYTTRSSTQKHPEDRSPDRKSTSPTSPRRQQPVEEPEDYTFSSLREETNQHHTSRTTYRSPKDSPLNQTSLPDDDDQDHSPARSTSTVSSQKRVTSLRNTSSRLTEDSAARRPRRPSGNEPSTPTSTGRGPKPRGAPETIAARRNIFEKSPGDVSPRPGHRRPSYMDHTKSSMEHSRRDSLEVTKTTYSRKSSMEDEPYEPSPRGTVKFGVAPKSRDEPKPKRQLSASEIPNIEDVFDLEFLEEILNIVTSYEQRRRVRAQIRIVKKLLETKSKEEVSKMTKITTIRKTSSTSQRDSPIPRRDTPMRPDRYHASDDIDSESVIESHHIEEHEEIIRERSVSPQTKTSKTITKVTEVRKLGEPASFKRAVPKKEEPKDSKPIWATKNILKKPSENEKVARALSAKKTTSTTSTSRMQQTHRQRVAADEDCITSSYGIGPTDEDGRPLFGIRALKKKTTSTKTAQPSETTKVTGTVITEKFYSENGAEPVGERKVTVYSTNPEDLQALESQYDRRDSETVKRESLSKDGLTSVTKVQKIGNYKSGDVPALTDDAEFTKTSSKTVRRGSVKEMSEKFIRKESSSSVTEKSNNYPKAGLILRTRTNSGATADTADQYEVRGKSAEYDDESDVDECDVEIRTSRKHSKVVTESEDEMEIRRKLNTRSFLNSAGAKVTGVDDVLDRMRNADNVVVDGDTIEDREARSLLNKFLGASVLMSGMESIIPQKELKKAQAASDSLKKQEVKTTRVTKTIKTASTGGNSSSPVARETCDFEEIWDEETLKNLLEKSTSYEERRAIRARLRQLMAEREACADLVASVKAELNTDKTVKKQVESQQQPADDDSSGSEYEEIIEEYTASEDDDDEDEAQTATVVVAKQKEEVKEDTKAAKKITEDIKKTTITTKDEPSKSSQTKVVVVEKTTVIKKDATSTSKGDKDSHNSEESSKNKNGDDRDASVSDSSKGESLLIPLLQGLLHKNMPQARASNSVTPLRTATNTTATAIANQTSNNLKSSLKSNNTRFSSTSSNCNNSLGDSDLGSEVSRNSSLGQQAGASLRVTAQQIEDSGTESGEDLRLIAAGIRDSMQIEGIENQSDMSLIKEVTNALNRLESSLKEGKDLALDSSKKNTLLALVERLQTGLTAPDKLSAAEGEEDGPDETSSPEADVHRSSRQRFAKRRNRNNRHTVGVSKEELADARRYMEEKVMIENLSNCTTPECNAATTPPQFFAIQKQASSGAILTSTDQEEATSGLFRPNQFVPSNLKQSTDVGSGSHADVQLRPKKTNPVAGSQRQSAGDMDYMTVNNSESTSAKRPLSDSYDAYAVQGNRVSFSDTKDHPETLVQEKNQYNRSHHFENQPDVISRTSPDTTRGTRFNSKKQLMKRANTIDIPKTHRYNPEFDTDSEFEDKSTFSVKGLRGTVQVNVKRKPRQVVPNFEPKTENDHKFLAFIQKQNPSPGLGWNTSKSVSNWTNKFGNIKNVFEAGAPPPGANGPRAPTQPGSSAKNFWKKNEEQNPPPKVGTSVLTSALKAKERNEQRSEVVAPKPIHMNQFSHNPQSAFRPVDIVPEPSQSQFKPIPMEKPVNVVHSLSPTKPYNPASLRKPPSESPTYSQPSPTKSWIKKNTATNSPVTLPWTVKPPESNVLKMAATKFESKSPLNAVQRHHSFKQQEKRPSLPNATHPYQYQYDGYSMPNYMSNSQPASYAEYPPPRIVRENSLTNPQAEPLVLTPEKPAYSPLSLQPYDYYDGLNSNVHQTDMTDDDIDDMESMTEYRVEAKVMGKPVTQQAVTVGKRTSHVSDDEVFGKNSRAAKNLLSVMKNIGNSNGVEKASKKVERKIAPTACISPDGRAYQAPIVEPLFPDVTKFETNRMPDYIGPQPAQRQKQQQVVDYQKNPVYVPLTDYQQQQPPVAPPRSKKIGQEGPSAPAYFPQERPNVYQPPRRDAPSSLTLQTGPLSPPGYAYSSPTKTPDSSPYTPQIIADGMYMQNVPTFRQQSGPNTPDDYMAHQVPPIPTPRQSQAQSYQPPPPIVNLPQIPLETSYTKVYDKPRDIAEFQPTVYPTSPVYPNAPRVQQPTSPRAGQQPGFAPQQAYQPRTEVPAQYYQSAPAYQQNPEVPQQFYQSPKAQQSPQAPMYPQQQVTQPAPYYQSPKVQATQQAPVFSPQQAEPLIQYGQPPQKVQQPMSPPYQPAVLPQVTQQASQPPASYYQSPKVQASPQAPVFSPQYTEPPFQYVQPQQKVQQAPQPMSPPYQSSGPPPVKQQAPQPMYQPQAPQQVKQQAPLSSPYQSAPVAQQAPKPAQQPKPQVQTRTEPVVQSSNSQYSAASYRQQQTTVSRTAAVSPVKQPPPINTAALCKQASLDGRSRVQAQSQFYEKVEEVRRKSLGNVLEVTRLEREARDQKAAAIKQDMYSVQQDVYSQQVKTEKKVESQVKVYKSSAPDDTPDIVKSSLAKEDIPILKKFGPPQRHCYIPNAYQNPLTKSETTVIGSHPQPSPRKMSEPSVNRGPIIVETPSTPQPDGQDEIPRNIVFNNVNAFTSMSRRYGETTSEYTSTQTRPNKLSKCDSWNQICQIQNAAKPASPKFNNTSNALRRTKSGHTLALPKLYEAGYDRVEMTEKQKTVAAYFSGQKSPNSLSRNSSQTRLYEPETTATTVSVKKSSINRIKTSEKASIGRQNPSSGLSRSHTMPHIANVNMLDETNVEDAFEQLMNGLSTTTTEKTETKQEDGAVVTTTTKVTTRTVTGTPKPVSPFAKFQQLDKQSSLQSPKSPLTPTTPGGSSTGSTPIFRFTDPALNARAATVKEQLLQWCQSKTQEYENVQITNFSQSWTDGLAFCALIHHFLPDAFDYSKLTPKQRRYNFDLAFRVADEKAGIAPLLDVEDMVVMKRPDWKCVFTYVQSIYRRFRNCQ